MKQNSKQIAYSARKTLDAQHKILRRFYFTVCLIFGITMAGIYLSNDNLTFDDLMTAETPIGIAVVMGASISQVPDTKKRGKLVKNRIYIIFEDQIDKEAVFAGPSGRNMPNIPLKAGEYWHFIETPHKTPPKPRSNGEGGDIASNLKNELEIVIGGYEDELMNFAENGCGLGALIVFELCATGEKFIGGTMCKPLLFDSFNWASEDNTAMTCMFSNENGRLWLNYSGTTPLQAADTVNADAVTIALTSNPQYQLTSGAAAAASITGFSAVTDADVNRVVTLFGSGGAFPSTIETGNDFLLVDGATWTANSRAQISFKIFKDNDASYKFIEVANSRTTGS